MQIFSRFGGTRHREVHFSTFSGKLTFQCTSTRSGPRNLPFCPGSLQDTFYYLFLDITPTYFSNIFCKHKKSRESKIWKSKNPGSLTGAQNKASVIKYGENIKRRQTNVQKQLLNFQPSPLLRQPWHKGGG